MSLLFLREFIRSPQSIGAVLPSSARLSQKMIDCCEIKPGQRIVEIGPGTGALTTHLSLQIPEGCQFDLIEKNPVFVEKLKKRFPQLCVHCSCAGDHLRSEQSIQEGKIDRVLSGLPWASFPEPLQRHLLESIVDNMSDTGRFVTFAYLQGRYLPAGKRFSEILQQHFSRVWVSTPVWRNIPPALVVIASKS